MNTNITVKNVAVSKKHIKGTSDVGREKITHAFHENTFISLCVYLRQGEDVLFPLIFLTLLPFKSNLVAFFLLEFNEPTSMSNKNPCKAFWDSFDQYLFYK